MAKPIPASQRAHNIRTKVRLISDRVWRTEGWGVCTGDLERAFILREMDILAGIEPQPIPKAAQRAMGLAPAVAITGFDDLLRIVIND